MAILPKKPLQIKKLNSKKAKKNVLLINPQRKNVLFTGPHNGLAILASILKKRGHNVRVIDFAYSYKDRNRDISFFIKDSRPDIIGVSIYTPNAIEAEEMIAKINKINPDIPLMVGGPHATLYTDILQKNKAIDYICRGEAELIIFDIIEKAKKQKKAKVVESKFLVDLDTLPLPDYKSFYNWESMTHYSIMTSRGCPFQCSFCASAGLSYRRWRPRDLNDCIRELETAKKEISPNLKFVVFDDNPTTDKERFNRFLEMYSKKIKTELTIVNTRADCINEEFVRLLKKCKVDFLSVGVEHAHPKVFELVGKGETLEQIKKAARLIKKYKISLGLSFVIGLPEDSLERTKASIKFAKELNADELSINMLIPYRYTGARQWFEEHNSKLYNEIGHDAQPFTSIRCEPPVVETTNFTLKEREKAYYMFLFGVAEPRMSFFKLPEILSIVKEYNLYEEFFLWIPKGIVSELKHAKKFVSRSLSIYRNYGIEYLMKRVSVYIGQKKIYRNRNKNEIKNNVYE